jgi:hypothetical protein
VVTVEDARRGTKQDLPVDELVGRLRAEVEEKLPR